MNAAKVVFVADDTIILAAIERLLRDEPFGCELFDNAAAALDWMERNRVQLIVADLGMPGGDGLELLQNVRQRDPDVIRVALCGLAERERLFEAIDGGLVCRYIPRPWDAVELVSLVRQSIDLYALRRRHDELAEELARRDSELERSVEERSERLLAVGREAELGKYISQIVHNLKRPLQAIGGAVLLANLLLSEDDPIHAELKRCLDAVLDNAGEMQKEIAGIIAHTVDDAFMRRGRVDVNQIVRREVEFYELDEQYRRQIAKSVRLDDSIPTVLGNPLQIKQIADNLIKNAIDAMEESPTKLLTVTTSYSAGSIRLTVADSGCGIPAENFDKVFSPYFTTKPLGKGTGIGLASVKRMVEAYGGTIEVDSQLGVGTSVVVDLPVSPTAAPEEGDADGPG